jgi:hypothetical protein
MSQQHRKAWFSFIVAAFVVATVTPAHAAVKIAGANDDMFANIGVLLQGRVESTESAAPDHTNNFDAYLRRVRVLLWGQINPMVNFFLETDSPSFGKGGASVAGTSNPQYIQDAWMELNLSPMFQLDVGMILVPFSHMGMQSAAALLSEDYHSSVIKYPTGSNNIWRDWGFMVRGLLIDHYLEYRLGVFNGVTGNNANSAAATATYTQQTDPRNPTDMPRIVGRLTFNVFDAEGGPGLAGMYTKGVYLKETENGLISPKRIVAISGAVDWQKGVNATWGAVPATGARPFTNKNYLSYEADAFVDFPLAEGKMAVTGQVNYYHWGYGDMTVDSFKPGGNFQFTGNGISSELGFRFDKYAAVVSYDQFRADRGTAVTTAGATTGDSTAEYVTLVYWWHALAANVKLELGRTQLGGGTGNAPWAKYASVQTQLFF